MTTGAPAVRQQPAQQQLSSALRVENYRGKLVGTDEEEEKAGMFVESILSAKGSEVFTISPDATIGELIAELARHNIGAVVVMDNGNVAGIISERDIVRHLAGSAEGFRAKPVSTLMTRSPITCKPTDTIDSAMAKMSSGRFRHLPVIEDGRLVGIISIGDVVKRKIEEAEQEAGALRQYIAS